MGIKHRFGTEMVDLFRKVKKAERIMLGGMTNTLLSIVFEKFSGQQKD